MAGLTPVRLTALTVTATLQQGLVLDPRYGVALDGLLASLVRHRAAQGRPGADLDGGLNAAPADWDLPLARCTLAGDDWHWAASTGQAVDGAGQHLPAAPADPHRLMVRLDERRAEQVALRLPRNVGGPRGRYRTKVTPVLATVCPAITWHAYGDPDLIAELLTGLPSVGGRRGTGEGTVLAWAVTEQDVGDPDAFAHTHPDGSLGRPVPAACARQYGFPADRTGLAGLRPPMFHRDRQRLLVLPGEGVPDATS